MKKKCIKFILGLIILNFMVGCVATKPKSQENISYLKQNGMKKIEVLNDEGMGLEKALFKGEVYLIENVVRTSTRSSASGVSDNSLIGSTIKLAAPTTSNSWVVKANKFPLKKVKVFSNEDGIIEIAYELPKGIYKTSHYADGGFSWDEISYDYGVAIEGKMFKKNYYPSKVGTIKNSIEVIMIPNN